VLPVAGGLAFFVVLGLVLWGIAAVLAGNSDDLNERLSSPTYEVGDIDVVSEIIASGGPVILPDLRDTSGSRTIVLDHSGDDPRFGWRVYFAHPADRDLSCKVEQVRGTREFTDCGGRTMSVEELAPAAGVAPIVSDVVVIDLRGAATGTDPPATTS
jgi:hypothetical protein